MTITKSHCRFPVFVYLSGQLHQVTMKLESKRSSFISLLETLKIDRKMDRYIKIGIMSIHTHTYILIDDSYLIQKSLFRLHLI